MILKNISKCYNKGKGTDIVKIIFPIGVSDFEEIIRKKYYNVDKSLFIKDIIEDGAKVVLLLRSRRFGKTLNISMLKYFYKKTAYCFKDLNSTT